MKTLLKRFHLNGHTIGFCSETQKLELHTKQIVPCESIAEEVSFELSHHDVSSRDSTVKSGAPNDNFLKLSVRKTIWDLEFLEHLLLTFLLPCLS